MAMTGRDITAAQMRNAIMFLACWLSDFYSFLPDLAGFNFWLYGQVITLDHQVLLDEPVTADRVDVWLGVPTQAQDGGEYLLAHPAKVADVAPLLDCLLAHGDDDGGGVGVNLPLKRTS